MSEDEREIVEWFYFSNNPLKELAEKKGMPLNTIAKRKSRAIEKLKKYFLELYS